MPTCKTCLPSDAQEGFGHHSSSSAPSPTIGYESEVEEEEEKDEEEDNICRRWSLDDDKELYTGVVLMGRTVMDMAIALKRGINGTQQRLLAIQNPKKNAYKRLFGIDPSLDIRNFLRPVQDVIERIIWDPSLPTEHFSFVYQDRFDGLQERSAAAANDSVKGKERMLIMAIPSHRIVVIKYKKRIVWDKGRRQDLFFGSSAIDTTDTSTAALTIVDVINTYSEWLQTYYEKVQQNQASKNSVTIYLTIDGVLADFNAGVKRYVVCLFFCISSHLLLYSLVTIHSTIPTGSSRDEAQPRCRPRSSTLSYRPLQTSMPLYRGLRMEFNCGSDCET